MVKANSVRAALAVVLVALVAGCGSSGSSSVDELTVSGAWARPTPPGATNGVVYFDLVSPAADELVSVSVPSDVADDAGLHETVTGGTGEAMPNMPNMPNMDMGDGTNSMQALDRVPLAAQARVRFEPGGKHVMLMGLAGALTAGEHFTLSLGFASGAHLDVDVEVRDNAPAG